MSTDKFLQIASEELLDYIADQEDVDINELETIQVWYCKTIQNHKGLFIVKNFNTNQIYKWFIEVTYNGDAQELYLDFYTKVFKHIEYYGE